jgi:hypothetical protein
MRGEDYGTQLTVTINELLAQVCDYPAYLPEFA